MWLEYFLQYRLDAPSAEVLLSLVVEVDAHLGSLANALGRLDGVLALAVARPGEGRLGAGLAAGHLHLVRDHERRVEADAELANEVGVLFRVIGKLVEEPARAGPRDRAQVVLELLLVHPDAVVLDDDGLVFLVNDDSDRRLEGDRLEGLVGNAQVAELVDRVGRIGDELAQEDLLVRVKGMDDEVEQTRHFRLKMVLGHFFSPERVQVAVLAIR